MQDTGDSTQDSDNVNMNNGNEVEKPKPIHLMDNLHTFELFKDYTVPEWSAKPTKKFSLEVIKEGTIIEEVNIGEKEFYLIGKLPDLCDIVLDHSSISRKHAIIQHKVDDEVYVYDLGSANGTRVNKREIPGRMFVKLNVGDVIKFGHSTRLFILGLNGEIGNVGDEDKEENEGKTPTAHKKTLKSEYLKLLASNAGSMEHSKPRVAQKMVDPEGISGGMVDEEEIKLDAELLRKLPDLTEKDYERIDNYEKKVRKMENLEHELNQLGKEEKDKFGLTEGNRIKKEQLQSKVNELWTQLEIMEENLRFTFFDEMKEKKKINRDLDDDTFGDDDFFDRALKKKVKTDPSKDNKSANLTTTENFNTLKAKLEKLLDRRQEINMTILNSTLNTGNQQNTTVTETSNNNQEQKEEEVDELEKFMK